MALMFEVFPLKGSAYLILYIIYTKNVINSPYNRPKNVTVKELPITGNASVSVPGAEVPLSPFALHIN
jgi:hypothetical protein